MFSALGRLFGSSTVLSGVVSLVATTLAASHGIQIPAELAAAVPLAVGWKEGKRREAEADAAFFASRKQ